MPLTKELKIDKIVIDEDRTLQVRTAVIIKDGNKEISRGYSYETITPLDNVSQKNDKVKNLSSALHTKKTKDKYKKNAAKKHRSNKS